MAWHDVAGRALLLMTKLTGPTSGGGGARAPGGAGGGPQ